MATSEMMHDMRVELRERLGGSLTDEDAKDLTKRVKDLADELVTRVQYSIQDDLIEHLSYHVKEMAGRAVEALLAGNEAEMMRWLSCDKRGFTGRSDGAYGDRTIDRQHPVIHGKLFEQGCVKLRKDIVEAHRGMIVSERIKDLEDQVASLVAQNNKLERERDEVRGRAFDRV